MYPIDDSLVYPAIEAFPGENNIKKYTTQLDHSNDKLLRAKKKQFSAASFCAQISLNELR